MEWSTAQWNQADFQRLAQPSLSGYMISSSPRTLHQFLSGIVHFFKIQSLQQRRIARKYASLFVQTAVSAVTAPFIPERPSAHITRTSFTPRFFSSFRTPSQYFALSFSPICMDNTCLCPVRLTARTTYAASFLSVRFLVQKDVQHQ